MPRQKRSVQIQACHWRNLQHGPRENLPISNHHDHIRRQRPNFRHRFFVFDPGWLQNRDVAAGQRHLDRGRFDPLVSPRWLVRLSNHSNQLMFGRTLEPAQDRHADFARPDEDDAHCALELQALRGSPPPGTARDRPLRHHFLTRGDFALAH